MTNFPTIVEHHESRQERFLRAQRLQIALVIAAIEGILVLAGSIPWWVVLVAAAAAVAVSQLVVVLVPIAAAILTVLAVALLVLIAVIALGALLRDRR